MVVLFARMGLPSVPMVHLYQIHALIRAATSVLNPLHVISVILVYVMTRVVARVQEVTGATIRVRVIPVRLL
jgi:hypothetical protein